MALRFEPRLLLLVLLVVLRKLLDLRPSMSSSWFGGDGGKTQEDKNTNKYEKRSTMGVIGVRMNLTKD